jgi:hypothetical protein
MLIHVDNLMPDMRLERDIEIKAGSFLVTLNELIDDMLSVEMIGKIRRFSSQLAPEKNMVYVVGDEFVYKHLKSIIENDVKTIMESITAGRDYPNFLADSELQEKVHLIVSRLISNSDIIRNMYELKIQGRRVSPRGDYIQDHCIRVTLLSIAIGLKMRWSVIPLVNVGMAAVLHDMSILKTSFFNNLKRLDDLNSDELEEFVKEHQKESERIFSSQKLEMMPHTRNDIMHMVSNHHRPDFGDEKHKTTFLLYLAELVDEMITTMPHKVRYNFSKNQIQKIGKNFQGQVGLSQLLLGFVKLFRGQDDLWEMVRALADLFCMQELLAENYEDKLEKILSLCPYNCAEPYPSISGNILPRTIYCKKSDKKNFTCEHLSRLRIDIQSPGGKMRLYFKCATLSGKLQELNKSGRKGEARLDFIPPDELDNSRN